MKKRRNACIDKLIRTTNNTRDQYNRYISLLDRMREKSVDQLSTDYYNLFSDIIKEDSYHELIGLSQNEIALKCECSEASFKALQLACSFFGIRIR